MGRTADLQGDYSRSGQQALTPALGCRRSVLPRFTGSFRASQCQDRRNDADHRERRVRGAHRRASRTPRTTAPRPVGLGKLERLGLSVSRTSAIRRPPASCHRTHASAGSAGSKSAAGSARSFTATYRRRPLGNQAVTSSSRPGDSGAPTSARAASSASATAPWARALVATRASRTGSGGSRSSSRRKSRNCTRRRTRPCWKAACSARCTSRSSLEGTCFMRPAPVRQRLQVASKSSGKSRAQEVTPR